MITRNSSAGVTPPEVSALVNTVPLLCEPNSLQNPVRAAEADWYRDMCEQFAHPTPSLQPNLHNSSAIAVSGGLFQEGGHTRCIEELAQITSLLAMFFARIRGYPELFSA